MTQNYKITVPLGTAQARGKLGGGVLPHIIRGECRILLSLPRSRFCLVTQTKRVKTLTLCPIPPPRPNRQNTMAGTDYSAPDSGCFSVYILKALPGYAVFFIHMLEGVVEK